MYYRSPFIDALAQMARQHGEVPVLGSMKEQITASQLFARSKRLAQGLHAAGFRENDLAVIAAAPGPDFLYLIYATMLLRGKIAIIDPEMGRDNYRAKLQQLQPRWAFVDSRLLFLQEHPLLRYLYFKLKKNAPYFPYQQGIRTVAVGMTLPLWRKHLAFKTLLNSGTGEITLLPSDPDHEYAITYTSGTLGEPKGVVATFASLHRSISLLAELVGVSPEESIGTYLPHFMLLGISANLPVFLYDPTLPPRQKLALFRQEKVSILFGPPADFLPLVAYCEQQGEQLPACLRHLLFGSAPIHASFLRRVRAVAPAHLRLTCLYGMTELLMVAYTDGDQKINYSGDGDLVGQLAPGVQLQLTPDGEILLQSDQLFARYFHEHSRPAYHATGDLGKLDQAGQLVLTGRKKDMIIRRNTNIYPAIYETTIRHIPEVEDAVLIGLFHAGKQDEEVFLVVEGKKANPEKIKKQLAFGRYSIDREAQPDHIVVMPLPRKGRQSKVDRNALRHLLKETMP